MGDVVRLHDYHLRRVVADSESRKGELIAFAKTGQPIVEGADRWAGKHVPEGIDGLAAVFPDWDVG